MNMESATLTIEFCKGEPLPKAGDELRVKGMAGWYDIQIKQVLSSRDYPSGETFFVKVLANRRLAEPDRKGA